MAVFRVERTSDYTVMSNYHLRDKRLSLKAKGLLSQMLSLPEDWDYTLTGLCYINRESKDAAPRSASWKRPATYAAAKPSTAAASSLATSTRSMNGHRNRHRTNRHRKNRRREIRQRENRCRKSQHNKI